MGYGFTTVQLVNSLLNSREKAKFFRHVFERAIVRQTGKSI